MSEIEKEPADIAEERKTEIEEDEVAAIGSENGETNAGSAAAIDDIDFDALMKKSARRCSSNVVSTSRRPRWGCCS